MLQSARDLVKIIASSVALHIHHSRCCIMHKARSIAYERIIDAHTHAHTYVYIYIHTICDVCISTGYMTIKSLGDAVVSRNVFRYSFIWFICNSNAFIKCNNRLNIVAWRMLWGKTPFCTPRNNIPRLFENTRQLKASYKLKRLLVSSTVKNIS